MTATPVLYSKKYIMDFQEYGALIRSHRKKASLTQRQLADELQMSRATISFIETGAVTEIGVRKLSRLCARIGLAVQVVPQQPPSFSDVQREQARQRTEALRQTTEILSGKKSKESKRKKHE